MHAQIISPANALQATRFLLNLDVSAIQNPDKPTVRYEVLTIKQALAALKKAHPVELHNQNLFTLTASANHLVNDLCEEARERLTDFMAMNQTL